LAPQQQRQKAPVSKKVHYQIFASELTFQQTTKHFT